MAKSVTIPEDKVDWFIRTIDDMNAIFNDEKRIEYFDGDDLALSVANELDDLLTAAGARQED